MTMYTYHALAGLRQDDTLRSAAQHRLAAEARRAQRGERRPSGPRPRMLTLFRPLGQPSHAER